MFPSLRLKLASSLGGINDQHLLTATNYTNFGKWQTIDAGWHTSVFVGGKKEFVGVASVKCELKVHIAPSELRPGNCFFPEVRAHSALLANVREIGGEAIADVDHCSSNFALTKDSADLQTWLRNDYS